MLEFELKRLKRNMTADKMSRHTDPSICSLLQTILQTLYPTTLKILRNVHKYTIIIYVVIYTHSDNRSVNKVRSVISNNVINKNSISLKNEKFVGTMNSLKCQKACRFF